MSEPRKMFVCVKCDAAYSDIPVTECDCDTGANEFSKAVLLDEEEYTNMQSTIDQQAKEIADLTAKVEHYIETCHGQERQIAAHTKEIAELKAALHKATEFVNHFRFRAEASQAREVDFRDDIEFVRTELKTYLKHRDVSKLLYSVGKVISVMGTALSRPANRSALDEAVRKGQIESLRTLDLELSADAGRDREKAAYWSIKIVIERINALIAELAQQQQESEAKG